MAELLLAKGYDVHGLVRRASKLQHRPDDISTYEDRVHVLPIDFLWTPVA